MMLLLSWQMKAPRVRVRHDLPACPVPTLRVKYSNCQWTGGSNSATYHWFNLRDGEISGDFGKTGGRQRASMA
jgi:hypothetical protein